MSVLANLSNSRQIFHNGASLDENAIALSGDTLRNLQNVLLEMYLDLKAACDKNGCKAFLCGGSALGAVRNRGFIPWDDDFDVAMSRRDYNKLKLFFDKELSDKYILNAPGISEHPLTRFPKILMKGTVFEVYGEKYNEETSRVFLDIFLIDNIPDQWIRRTLKGLFVNFCEFASAQVYVNINWKESRQIYERAGRGYAWLRRALGLSLSIVSYKKWLETIDLAVQYDDENTEYCGLCTGRKHYFGEILRREAFFPGKKAEFAGYCFDIFSEVDTYLKNLYGIDYMNPPEENEREHHFVTQIKLPINTDEYKGPFS